MRQSRPPILQTNRVVSYKTARHGLEAWGAMNMTFHSSKLSSLSSAGFNLEIKMKTKQESERNSHLALRPVALAAAMSVVVAMFPMQASLAQTPSAAVKAAQDKPTLVISPDTLQASADGQTRIRIRVKVSNAQGQALPDGTLVTIESNGGRIRLSNVPNARTDELGPNAGDADSLTPGIQTAIAAGQVDFQLIAPSSPQDVTLRVSLGQSVSQTVISFRPDLRDWIAAGVVEGVISLTRTKNESATTPLRINDGFEEQLTRWSNEFSRSNSGLTSKAGTAAGRAAFFVKGVISGETLLNMSFDSDKETRGRILRDIRAEELYPVYGDASIKTIENKSRERLYVRLDRGRDFLLFGDFSTGATAVNPTSKNVITLAPSPDLGAYARTLTGLNARWMLNDQTGSNVGAFFSHDRLTQFVEEVNANGTSGPYSISRNDALEGSERVELIVRDRNNPGRVIEQRVLARLSDYTFDPFAGRLLLNGPLSSTNAQGNPQSLRINYEVDSNGERYDVFGLQAQLQNESASLAANIIVDENPFTITTGDSQTRVLERLASVRGSLKLGETGLLSAEMAQTRNRTQTGDLQDEAYKLEATWSNQSASASAFVSRAGRDFYNPNASVNLGRSEAGLRGETKITDTLRLQAEILKSEDSTNGADRLGGTVALNWDATQQFALKVGLRHSKDNGSGLYTSNSGTAASSLYSGTGLTPSSGGLFGGGTNTSTTGQVSQLGTVTGNALETTTLLVGALYKATDKLSLGLEAETQVAGDKAWSATANAQYQIAPLTKIHARYTAQTGLGSSFDRAERNNQFVLGVSNDYMLHGLGAGGSAVEGQVFSEYRLRDSLGAREAQLTNGLKNTVAIAQGLKATLGLERIKFLDGNQANATAVVSGLDYTASELWKGSARLEWRGIEATSASAASDAWLFNGSVARKLDYSWTLLLKDYYSITDSKGVLGTQSQNRLQLGFAYRPVDHNRFDALGKLELKNEKNAELPTAENRRVVIGSVHANWHPSRVWWLSGRVAAKSVNETLDGVRDKFNATLVSGRLIYDLTERWDVGLAASVMQGQGDRQYMYGAEMGYALKQNLWLSAGYNWSGFTDRDLTGSEYTKRGPFIRLRFKFDENLWRSNQPSANATLERKP
jgi:hypothetical protein